MYSIPPYIGIDFGTSKSSMAWYDPGTGRAEIIRNKEGKQETPSIVYLGHSESDVRVGDRAEKKLAEKTADLHRFVISVKRNLISAPTKILDDGRIYKPVDVAAKILQKLREDAESQRFYQPVTRAVITHPASFDTPQQDKIRQAAILAGFKEVELLPEPVSAALAYGHTGHKVGNYILIYDFGGGTFDVAVLVRVPDGSLSVTLKPRGLKDCGGDDLDRELYGYCEEIAQQKLRRGISLTGDIDLRFLRDCRARKEDLSYDEESTFSSRIPSNNGQGMFFEHTVSRTTYEKRISKYIENTVSLTQETMKEAHSNNYKVDTMVLIGGSSRVPLVLQRLTDALTIPPREWDERDFAVALGAAYHAHKKWGPVISPQPGPVTPPAPSEAYRRAIKQMWEPTKGLTSIQGSELKALKNSLYLNNDEAATIEREIMGRSLRDIDWVEYRTLVAGYKGSEMRTATQVQTLAAHAYRLGLSSDEASTIEREILSATKEELLRATPAVTPPLPPINKREVIRRTEGNGTAVAGLIFGIISIFMGIVLPLPIIGIILSAVGRKSAASRTMATWGLWLSIVGLALWLLILALSIH